MSKFKIPALLFLIAVDLYLIIFYAPVEVNQGLAQKIFYLHVPSAIVMMLFFLTGGVFSSAYLIAKKTKFDVLALSFIEIGFVFCTIVLLTGPIWARLVWGVWWTWDPRLTATLFVWLVFLGYFLLRTSMDSVDHARTYGSVLAIFGCLDIPIILLAVRLWRGVHPQVLSARQNMPDEMWITFIVSFITILALASFLVYKRYKSSICSSY